MIGKIFLQFDPWKHARLAWKLAAAPAPDAPAGAETVKAAPPPATASSDVPEEGKNRVEAAKTKVDLVADAATDTQPAVPAAATKARKVSSSQIKNHAPKLAAYFAGVIKNPKNEAKLAADLVKGIAEPDKGFLKAFIQVRGISAKEEDIEKFKEQFKTDGKFDAAKVAQKFIRDEFTNPMEVGLAQKALMQDLEGGDYKKLAADNIFDAKAIPDLAALKNYVNAKGNMAILPILVADAQLEETGKLFQKYEDGYKKYQKNPNAETQKTFLASITDTKDKDKEKMTKALNDPATAAEKEAVLMFSLNGTKLSPDEIATKAEEGGLNPREALIAVELITKEDIDAFEKADKIKPEIANAMRAKLAKVAQEAAPSNLPEKKDYWAQAIETLTKFFEKISALLAKAMSGISEATEGPKFAKSPLGAGEGKFKTGAYTEGKPLMLGANAGAEVCAVRDGTVIETGQGFVVIQEGDKGAKIKYSNLTYDLAAIKKGAAITAGKPIGTVAGESGLGLQYFDAQNQEQDPTSLLRDFIEKPAPVTPPAPPVAPAAAPAPPAGEAGAVAVAGAVAGDAGATVAAAAPGAEAAASATTKTAEEMAAEADAAAEAARVKNEELNKSMVDGVNNAFSSTLIVTDATTPIITLPFRDGETITPAAVEFYANRIVIGSNTYTMSLPESGKLESITPEDAPTDAGYNNVNFTFTGGKNVPLPQMLAMLNDMRAGNTPDQFNIVSEPPGSGTTTITFIKTT